MHRVSESVAVVGTGSVAGTGSAVSGRAGATISTSRASSSARRAVSSSSSRSCSCASASRALSSIVPSSSASSRNSGTVSSRVVLSFFLTSLCRCLRARGETQLGISVPSRAHTTRKEENAPEVAGIPARNRERPDNAPGARPRSRRRPPRRALLRLLRAPRPPRPEDVRLRRLRRREAELVPSRRDLVVFGGYCLAGAVYVAIGVAFVDFLLSFWVGVAYLVVAAWLVPALVRRLEGSR